MRQEQRESHAIGALGLPLPSREDTTADLIRQFPNILVLVLCDLTE
jgi:hypothetical protein